MGCVATAKGGDVKQGVQHSASRVAAALALVLGLAGLLIPSAAWAGTGGMAMVHVGGSAEFRPNELPRVIVRDHDNSCSWFGYVLGPHGYRRVTYPCRFADGKQNYRPSVRQLVALAPGQAAALAETTGLAEQATATVAAGSSVGTGVAPAGREDTPAIALRITAGLEPGVCADTETLEVVAGTAVYYCYTVTNTGDVPLALHNLIDSELGLLFTGLAYELEPGASLDTVTAGLEANAIVVEDRVNNATWRAYVDGGRSVDAVNQSVVTVHE